TGLTAPERRPLNNGECCEPATLPLHGPGNPRMYRALKAIYPGCVVFSLPVQRRNRRIGAIPAFFRPLREPARRAACRKGRFRARAASFPKPLSCSGGGFREATRPEYSKRLWASAPAPQLAFSDRPGGLAALLFQTGRRLMRQTELPTQPCEMTAPMRSNGSA